MVAVVCPRVRLGDGGVKEHGPAPAGKPLQVGVTLPKNVLLGSRVNVAFPVSVLLTFKVAGDSALMVKSGGVVTLRVMVVVCENPEKVPVMTTE